jgi:hypothetical protein
MKALKNALNIVLNKFIAFISSGLFLKLVFAWFLIQAIYMAVSKNRTIYTGASTYHNA